MSQNGNLIEKLYNWVAWGMLMIRKNFSKSFHDSRKKVFDYFSSGCLPFLKWNWKTFTCFLSRWIFFRSSEFLLLINVETHIWRNFQNSCKRFLKGTFCAIFASILLCLINCVRTCKSYTHKLKSTLDKKFRQKWQRIQSK